MTFHYRELLEAGRLLLSAASEERVESSDAQIRRAISTAYYALFHFLIEESTLRIAGRSSSVLRRRRQLARSFTHIGMRSALQRLTRPAPPELKDFLARERSTDDVPTFLVRIADTFIEAQAERHAADYNLNFVADQINADYLIFRVESAAEGWIAAQSDEDEHLKDAVCLLMLLRGKLRGDDA